jgi:hypothetical protein
MKVTKRQLRRIIKEELASGFAPTAAEEAAKVNSQISGMALQTDQSYWEDFGINTGEELALSLLGSTYSDMYKSIHGIRPRWENFNTPAEAQAAIDRLDLEVEDMIAADELEAQQQAEYEKKEKEIQALLPGEFDFEHVPRRSGMGRRMENKMRISRKQLSKIVKETMSYALNEYGSSFGTVSWYEDDENGELFDVEGYGDGLTKDKVYDILNDADTDDSLVNNIQMAIEDADDYSSGY